MNTCCYAPMKPWRNKTLDAKTRKRNLLNAFALAA